MPLAPKAPDSRPRVVALSGSLRAGSLNTTLLRIAAELAAPELEITLFDGIRHLPHYDQDLEGDLPTQVRDFRALVGAVPAVLISCPEYAYGVPGAFKNALDWLVGGPEFVGKRVALLNGSPRAVRSQEQVTVTVTAMAGIVVEAACVTLPLLGKHLDQQGILAQPGVREALGTGLRHFAEAIARATAAEA